MRYPRSHYVSSAERFSRLYDAHRIFHELVVSAACRRDGEATFGGQFFKFFVGHSLRRVPFELGDAEAFNGVKRGGNTFWKAVTERVGLDAEFGCVKSLGEHGRDQHK